MVQQLQGQIRGGLKSEESEYSHLLEMGIKIFVPILKNYYLGCIGKIKPCDLVKIIDVLYFGALWEKVIIYIIPVLA